MSEQIMINAVSRSELGSNRARNIRSENMVPAVIYGNEKELLNAVSYTHLTLPTNLCV